MNAHLEQLLRSEGIQPTAQRMEIAELALCEHQHFSAEQLLERATDKGSNVSRATIYNTLNLFVSKNLLKEILIDPTRVLYDSNTAFHHHILNTDTGELRDIEPVEFQMDALPALNADEQLDGVDLIIRTTTRRHNPPQ